MRIFYDTSAILNSYEFNDEDSIVLSTVTLTEIEHIKTSRDKDELVKMNARRISRLLKADKKNVEVILPDKKVEKLIKKFGLAENNDSIIMCTALVSNCDLVLSDDISFLNIGNRILGLNVEPTKHANAEKDNGYIEVAITKNELSKIMNDYGKNHYDRKINDYVIFNVEGVFQNYKWNGATYIKVDDRKVKSFNFGNTIAPLDPYQACAIDSLYENDMTAISGKAGSGKSTLALYVAMNLIEKHKYNRLIIMSNPLPLRGTKEIGFLPGSKDDKLLSANIGNILISKFGSEDAVRNLIDQGTIYIANMSDCRGMEIAPDEILYCTEIQNSSIDLIKMILQRPKEGAKIFIEGDYESQVDSPCFDGKQNGLKRVIDVFPGEPYFGHVDLPTVHRSKIAEKAAEL